MTWANGSSVKTATSAPASEKPGRTMFASVPRLRSSERDGAQSSPTFCIMVDHLSAR